MSFIPGQVLLDSNHLILKQISSFELYATTEIVRKKR